MNRNFQYNGKVTSYIPQLHAFVRQGDGRPSVVKPGLELTDLDAPGVKVDMDHLAVQLRDFVFGVQGMVRLIIYKYYHRSCLIPSFTLTIKCIRGGSTRCTVFY